MRVSPFIFIGLWVMFDLKGLDKGGRGVEWEIHC
jgi:hypothetical protein